MSSGMYDSHQAFNVGPEASRIHERLYQGSMPPPNLTVRRAGFTLLVLCAEEYQPPSATFGLPVVHAPMDDCELRPEDWTRAVSAARIVARTLRAHRAGDRVLVTCQAGLNRSGLVSALTLHLVTGMSGKQAVRLVQARRENALFNASFVRQLEGLRPLLRLDAADY